MDANQTYLAIREWAAQVRRIKNPFGPDGFNAKWNEGAERLSRQFGLTRGEWSRIISEINKETPS